MYVCLCVLQFSLKVDICVLVVMQKKKKKKNSNAMRKGEQSAWPRGMCGQRASSA